MGSFWHENTFSWCEERWKLERYKGINSALFEYLDTAIYLPGEVSLRRPGRCWGLFGVVKGVLIFFYVVHMEFVSVWWLQELKYAANVLLADQSRPIWWRRKCF